MERICATVSLTLPSFNGWIMFFFGTSVRGSVTTLLILLILATLRIALRLIVA
jgi:hypothetical protein